MPNKPETIFCGEIPVRTFTMNGKIKYAARDLCGILGYSRADKMLATIKSRPEYIDVITRGGTQRIRVVEDRDIEKVLAHSRHKNVPGLRDWLHLSTKTEEPKQEEEDTVLLMLMID